MRSDLAKAFGETSTLIQSYLADLRVSLDQGVSASEFPPELVALIEKLSNTVVAYSGNQASYAEARINKEVELLRAAIRANAVAGITRGNFYSNAIASLDVEQVQMDTQLPVIQAIIDAAHPYQTGGLT